MKKSILGYSFFILILLNSNLAAGQANQGINLKTGKRCQSEVLYGNNAKPVLQRICCSINLVDKIDARMFGGKVYWKYQIKITDLEKNNKNETTASFVIYDETNTSIIYQCIHENLDIKMLVFDKKKRKWKVVLKKDEVLTTIIPLN
jgi:hypothetical protein